MDFQSLIEQYGYAAVLIGTFFEGEAVLIIAGFLANQGYLKLAGVVVAAFAGAMLGDQLYFHIGRWKGQPFIESRPTLKYHSQRVASLLHSHQNKLILGFRFVYGIRTVTPFVLGASGVSPTRFLILNTIGALLWALAIGVAGFYFGKVLELMLGQLKDYEMLILGSMAGISLIAWLSRRLIINHRRRRVNKCN